MVYCDTLGWAPPSDLKPRVDFILDVFSRKLSLLRKPAQGRFVAHKPQSHVRGFHKCTSNCFYNIPLQSCGNICGVIVTIMGAISCIDPTLWRFGFLVTQSALPTEISWLKCPTSHACYLRRVLIHWLMTKNVNLQLLGINSSPPSAYSDNHSFGQQCFNDDLWTTTDPNCTECPSESSQSQPKKPHISEDGKTSSSEKIEPLPESSSPDDGTSNPPPNAVPLTTSPGPKKGKSKPSENSEPLPTFPGPDKGKSSPPDNGEPLPASLGPDKGNSNLSDNGDPPPATASAGPDNYESNKSENGDAPPSSPGPDDRESKPLETSEPLTASPDPDDGLSNPPDNGEPLAASLDPDTSKSNLSANGDPRTTSAGPDDSERDPSENGGVPPSSPGPDDSESTPSQNGYPPQPSPGPNEGESNFSENSDPPPACPSPNDGKSNSSQPEAPENETLPDCFQCPFCDLKCNVKSNLKRHIKRKHKDQQNSTGSLDDSGKCLCLECGFKCHRITDLRQHLTKCQNLLFRTESRTFATYSGKTITSNVIRKRLNN